jgi:hypothetical protein
MRESERSMLRSTVSKVMWVGRATVFLVGLSVILAVVLGVASAAFGANNDNFILGVLNSATDTTKLNGNVSGGPALQVSNPNTAAGSRGLQVNVAEGKPPILVNPTAGKATNLNADKLDGKDFTSEPWHEVGTTGEPAFFEHGVPGSSTIKFVNWGSPYNTAGFYKDSQGVVHLKGLVKWTNSDGSSGTFACGFPRVFKLPGGYRPAATEIRPSLMSDTLTRIDIGSDGWVGMCEPNRTIRPNDWLLLDGISFRAAN